MRWGPLPVFKNAKRTKVKLQRWLTLSEGDTFLHIAKSQGGEFVPKDSVPLSDCSIRWIHGDSHQRVELILTGRFHGDLKINCGGMSATDFTQFISAFRDAPSNTPALRSHTDSFDAHLVSMADFKLLADITGINYTDDHGHAKVFLARRNDGSLLALKGVGKMALEEADVVESFSEMLRGAATQLPRHPYISSVQLCINMPTCVVIGSDFAPGADLRSHLVGHHHRMSVDVARTAAAEILVGLEFLHRHRVPHGNLCPANVLVDAHGHCRLSDYGYSREAVASSKKGRGPSDAAHQRRTMQSCRMDYNREPRRVGQVAADYRCVDVMFESGGSVFGDWWSYAAVIMFMVTGRGPFSITKTMNERPMDLSSKLRTPISIPRYLEGTAVADLLTTMLNPDASQRYRDMRSDDQGRGVSAWVRAHPFFEGVDWRAVERGTSTPAFTVDTEHMLDLKYFSSHTHSKHSDLQTQLDSLRKKQRRGSVGGGGGGGGRGGAGGRGVLMRRGSSLDSMDSSSGYGASPYSRSLRDERDTRARHLVLPRGQSFGSDTRVRLNLAFGSRRSGVGFERKDPRAAKRGGGMARRSLSTPPALQRRGSTGALLTAHPTTTTLGTVGDVDGGGDDDTSSRFVRTPARRRSTGDLSSAMLQPLVTSGGDSGAGDGADDGAGGPFTARGGGTAVGGDDGAANNRRIRRSNSTAGSLGRRSSSATRGSGGGGDSNSLPFARRSSSASTRGGDGGDSSSSRSLPNNARSSSATRATRGGGDGDSNSSRSLPFARRSSSATRGGDGGDSNSSRSVPFARSSATPSGGDGDSNSSRSLPFARRSSSATRGGDRGGDSSSSRSLPNNARSSSATPRATRGGGDGGDSNSSHSLPFARGSATPSAGGGGGDSTSGRSTSRPNPRRSSSATRAGYGGGGDSNSSRSLPAARSSSVTHGGGDSNSSRSLPVVARHGSSATTTPRDDDDDDSSSSSGSDDDDDDDDDSSSGGGSSTTTLSPPPSTSITIRPRPSRASSSSRRTRRRRRSTSSNRRATFLHPPDPPSMDYSGGTGGGWV